MLIEALPLEAHLQQTLENADGILLTHGNHQRSAWPLRREIGAPVYAPAGAAGREKGPDGVDLAGDLNRTQDIHPTAMECHQEGSQGKSTSAFRVAPV